MARAADVGGLQAAASLDASGRVKAILVALKLGQHRRERGDERSLFVVAPIRARDAVQCDRERDRFALTRRTEGG